MLKMTISVIQWDKHLRRPETGVCVNIRPATSRRGAEAEDVTTYHGGARLPLTRGGDGPQNRPTSREFAVLPQYESPIPRAFQIAGKRITRTAIQLGRDSSVPITAAEAKRRLNLISGRKPIPISAAVTTMLTVAHYVRCVRANRIPVFSTNTSPRRDPRRDLANQLAVSIQVRFTNHVRQARAALIESHYRQSGSRWVGGERTIEISVGTEPNASGASEKVWHDKKVRSGTNSHLCVTFAPTWYTDIKRAGLAIVGGLVTTHAIKVEEGLWEAAWVEQGRGFTLRVGRGYIARSTDGTTLAHGKTPASAQRSANLQSPAGVQTAREKEAREVAEMERALQTGELDDVTITFAHARQAGLCEPGIRSWLGKHFDNPDLRVLRIGQIRRITDQQALIRRACERALNLR